MIKINLRWLVQAAALVLGILAFTRAFDLSKSLFVASDYRTWLPMLGWLLMLGLSLFLLMFTSYLKQRANDTLRNPINMFECLVVRLGLGNYRERGKDSVA